MRSTLIEALPAIVLVASEATVVGYVVGTLVLLPFIGFATTTLPAAVIAGILGTVAGVAFTRQALRQPVEERSA